MREEIFQRIERGRRACSRSRENRRGDESNYDAVLLYRFSNSTRLFTANEPYRHSSVSRAAEVFTRSRKGGLSKMLQMSLPLCVWLNRRCESRTVYFEPQRSPTVLERFRRLSGPTEYQYRDFGFGSRSRYREDSRVWLR